MNYEEYTVPKGGKVISSEHNSVDSLLKHLRKEGIGFD